MSDAKVTMHINEHPPPKMSRLTAHTETVKVTRFPVLIPYGVTVLRQWGNRWSIRCGAFNLSGHDGDQSSIIKLFLVFVKDSIDQAKKEAEFELPQQSN